MLQLCHIERLYGTGENERPGLLRPRAARPIATLPRTNVFEADFYSENPDDITSAPRVVNYATNQKDIERVLYNAIFSPGQDPPWQCSTGNCTFLHTYGTIGVCYSCQDASVAVTSNAACSYANSSYATQHPTSAADCPNNSSFIVESTFTASEYMKLTTNLTISSFGMVDTLVYVAAALTDIHVGVEADLFFGFLRGATANMGERIGWLTLDNSSCNSDKPEESWGCQGYGAATCSLQPCIQIYNATVSAGVLEEHLVASSSDTAWDMVYDSYGLASYLALVDNQCSSQNQSPSNQNSGMESRWLPYTFNLTGLDADPQGTDGQSSLRLPRATSRPCSTAVAAILAQLNL